MSWPLTSPKTFEYDPESSCIITQKIDDLTDSRTCMVNSLIQQINIKLHKLFPDANNFKIDFNTLIGCLYKKALESLEVTDVKEFDNYLKNIKYDNYSLPKYKTLLGVDQLHKWLLAYIQNPNIDIEGFKSAIIIVGLIRLGRLKNENKKIISIPIVCDTENSQTITDPQQSNCDTNSDNNCSIDITISTNSRRITNLGDIHTFLTRFGSCFISINDSDWINKCIALTDASDNVPTYVYDPSLEANKPSVLKTTTHTMNIVGYNHVVSGNENYIDFTILDSYLDITGQQRAFILRVNKQDFDPNRPPFFIGLFLQQINISSIPGFDIKVITPNAEQLISDCCDGGSGSGNNNETQNFFFNKITSKWEKSVP